MRILVAVALVLLMGVLDVSVAKRPKVPTGHVVLGTIRRFTKMRNLKEHTPTLIRRRRDTSESEDDSGVKEESTKNGGRKAFVTPLNHTEFHATLDKLSRNAPNMCSEIEYPEPVRFNASKLNPVAALLVGPVLIVADAVITGLMDALRSITEVLCQGDGQPLLLFLNTGGLECIKDRTDEFANCFEQLNTISDEGISNTANETYSTSYACNRLTVARNCYKSLFNACQKPSNLSYVDSVFDAFTARRCGQPSVATAATSA